MALSCSQAEERIEQALEGTLTPREARQLQRHLDTCPRCRQRYHKERRAVEALQALPQQDAPADLVQRVMAELPDLSPQLLGRIAEVLRRAVTDPDLHRRLQESPRAVLLAHHVALPPGMRIEIVPEHPAPLPTTEVLYLPLPEAPLQLEELDQRLAAMGLGSLFGFWW